MVVRRRIQQFADLTHQGRLAHIHLFGQEFVREFGIPEILADDGAELLQELLILSGESEHVDGHSRDSLLQRIAQEYPAVEDVLDTRNEVLQVERLLDIEVRSGLHRLDFRLYGTAGRDDEDRDVRNFNILADLRTQFEAGHSGHGDIRQQHVHIALLEDFQGFDTRRSHEDRIVLGEFRGQILAEFAVVVHDQNTGKFRSRLLLLLEKLLTPHLGRLLFGIDHRQGQHEVRHVRTPG